MMRLFFSFFAILFSISITAHTWEFGMKVVNPSGNPIEETVKIYKIVEGELEFEYLTSTVWRTGYSNAFWKGAGEEVNFFGDFWGDGNNTPNPSYYPYLEAGDYRIRIGNRYCILHIPTSFPNSADFVLIHQNGNFSFFDPGSGGVTISETKDWDLPLILGQKIENTQIDIGTVAVWDGVSFNDRKNAPYKFYLKTDQTQFLHGSPQILSSSKFYRWDDENFIDVINPKSKDWNEGSAIPSIDALLKNSIPSITIQSNLDGTGISAGELYFKDPWFMDSSDASHGNNLMNRGMTNALWWKRYPTTAIPFKPDYNTTYENGYTYKGVFLNQTPDPNNPNKPYYSIKIAAEQIIPVNGQNRKFYFLQWKGEPNKVQFQDSMALQTAVVFKDVNAIVKAKLKGNLVSGQTDAYTSNSQQKTVRDNNGFYHTVYSSMGMAWYTKSVTTDFGDQWTEEKNILPYNGIAKNPSLDFYDNNLLVVYEYTKRYSHSLARKNNNRHSQQY